MKCRRWKKWNKNEKKNEKNEKKNEVRDILTFSSYLLYILMNFRPINYQIVGTLDSSDASFEYSAENTLAMEPIILPSMLHDHLDFDS